MELLSTLTFDHFKQMEQLELKYYDDEHITPAEQAHEWYVRYPYTTHAAADSGNIVGFINLFPVTDKVFEMILTGQFNDKNLTIDQIVDISASETAPLHMFLSCILVEPEYRAENLTQLLLKKAVETYSHVDQRCDVILIDNVTPDGERFSRKYGFAPVRGSQHNTWIYSQRYERFRDRVMR